MQWIETGPWWLAVNSPELADVDDVTWCIWRVEAQSMSGTIIADVAQRFSLMSACADPWRMIRVLD
jgi:hypothetical protein